MKRIVIAIIASVLLVSYSWGQDTIWTHNYGVIDTTDLGLCGDVTSDGGFIVGGESSRIPGGDMFFTRCDANGDTLWNRNYGGAHYQAAYSVAHVDAGGADGGFIACGSTNLGLSTDELYVVRIDTNGDTLWTRYYGDPAHDDEGQEVIQTSDGGFLALGRGYNAANSTTDLFMIKIDASGNQVWSKYYGSSTGSDYGYGAVQLPDGGFGISGMYNASGNNNIWLLRIDSNGDTLWTRNYDLHGSTDRGDDIALADDGGFVIGGRTSNGGNLRMMAMKTDSLGNFLWSHEYVNSTSDNADSIDKTSDGGFVLCGINSYPFDCFVVRIDSLGDSLWAATYDYDGLAGDSEHSYEVRVYPDGDIMLFGYVDVHAGTGADDDFWVVKIEDSALPQGGCDYVVGDVNDSGTLNGLDVTYGVSYFKGGAAPPYVCECTPGNTWYVAGDVNGSCSYNGLDITYLVSYFKGGSDPIPCGDCPPSD
jgi:hypothetical protein